MFKQTLQAVVVLVALFGGIPRTNADDYDLGKCPGVDPMPNFSMKRMLGLWYAIQKTSTSDECLMYYFSEILPDEEYQVTEIKPHSTLLNSLRHEHYTTGNLKVPDPTIEAEMDLDLPLLDIGTYKFTVVMTDYDNYAAIFTCKKMASVIHKWSATILSRKRTLDMAYVDLIRTRLSSYNIDPFSMSIISQKQCPPIGDKGGVIKAVSDLVQGARITLHNLAQNVTSTVQRQVPSGSY